MPDEMDIELRIAKEENPLDAGLERVAQPSSYACPECHGVLLQLKESGRIRFRCHTGHAYSLESLLAAVSEGIDEAMWMAIRALEEGGMLMSRMAEHVQGHDTAGSQQLALQAEDVRSRAATIRKLVTDYAPLAAKP